MRCSERRSIKEKLGSRWPLSALLLACLLQGCEAFLQRAADDIVDPVETREYWSDAISGRVTDEESKEPLEGVVVVAVWELVGGLEGASVLGAVQVLETSTDKDGAYRLPAWGPIKHAGRGVLEPEAPKVLFFKQGYQFVSVRNFNVHLRGFDPNYGRSSIWSGRTVTLRNIKDDGAALSRSFTAFQRALLFAEIPEECYWKKIPRAILESMRQAKVLSARKIPYSSEIGSYLLINDANIQKRSGVECGSPRAFIESHQR